MRFIDIYPDFTTWKNILTKYKVNETLIIENDYNFLRDLASDKETFSNDLNQVYSLSALHWEQEYNIFLQQKDYYTKNIVELNERITTTINGIYELASNDGITQDINLLQASQTEIDRYLASFSKSQADDANALITQFQNFNAYLQTLRANNPKINLYKNWLSTLFLPLQTSDASYFYGFWKLENARLKNQSKAPLDNQNLKIENIATGTADTDAVNVAQIKDFKNLWEIKGTKIQQKTPLILDQQNKTIENLPQGQVKGQPIEVQQWQTRNNLVNNEINKNKTAIKTITDNDYLNKTNIDNKTIILDNGIYKAPDSGSVWVEGSGTESGTIYQKVANAINQKDKAILNVLDPKNPQDVATKNYVDKTNLWKLNGNFLQPKDPNKTIDANSGRITNIGSVQLDTDAANKLYVDTSIQQNTSTQKKEIYYFKINTSTNISYVNKLRNILKTNNSYNQTFDITKKNYFFEFHINFKWTSFYSIQNTIIKNIIAQNNSYNYNLTDTQIPTDSLGSLNNPNSVQTLIFLQKNSNDNKILFFLYFIEKRTRYIYDNSWNPRFINFEVIYYEI